MPDMDGPTTFQKLQADPAIRHIPVILLTAKLQPADRKRFAELGVAGVLAKPFDPLELASQVSESPSLADVTDDRHALGRSQTMTPILAWAFLQNLFHFLNSA